MGIVGVNFGRPAVVSTSKLAHAIFRIFDAIASLSERIKLEPFVPASGADGWFALGCIVEGHAVFKPDVTFVESVDAGATGG